MKSFKFARIFYLFIFLTGNTVSNNCAIAQETEEIYWSTEYKLKWTDFLAKKSSGRLIGAAAESSCVIEMARSQTTGKMIVKALFNPNESWVSSGIAEGDQSEHILSHEQLHFDIAELFARKLRQKVENIVLTSKRESQRVGKLFDQNFDAFNVFQIQYDKETNHGINREAQARWEKKVKILLRKLDGYHQVGQ